MPSGLYDVLLVMVGAVSMAGGFFIGSWHRRAAQQAEIDAEDLASDERMTRMIRSLIEDDVADDERPN
jgi:Na+/H+ antiporter NhaB